MYKQPRDKSAIVYSKEISNQRLIFQFLLCVTTPNLWAVLLKYYLWLGSYATHIRYGEHMKII